MDQNYLRFLKDNPEAIPYIKEAWQEEELLKKAKESFGSGWASFLMPFLRSMAFQTLGKAVRKDLRTFRLPVAPVLPDMFRAFRECPFEKLHTVILTRDVYGGRTDKGFYLADGMALSARYSKKAPAELSLFYKALGEFQHGYGATVTYSNEASTLGHDLKHWANQGILLLSCCMSAVIGRMSHHMTYWLPFVEYLIQKLSKEKDNIAYVLMGAYPMQCGELIENSTCPIYKCEDITRAVYGQRNWEHKGVLEQLTQYQLEKNNIKIRW